MTMSDISIDDRPIARGARIIAVLRSDSPLLDVAALRDSLDRLPTGTTDVAIVQAATTEAEVGRLAQHAGACATATPVTDALKRIANGKIVESIERSSVFRAAPPLVIPQQAMRNRIDALGQGAVTAGQLLGDELHVTLVEVAP